MAIKTLKKRESSIEFLKEAKIASSLKHENIVALIGVCIEDDANFIILELMEGGDILSYLKVRLSKTLKYNDIYYIKQGYTLKNWVEGLPKKLTKIFQPYICQQSKESLASSIKGNLRFFQNYRKTSKN